MPPRDDYDMPLKMYINCGDGEYKEIGKIPTITLSPDTVMMEEPMYKLQDIDFDSTYEIKTRIRYCRGLLDTMCGVPSIHAWRYTRLCRRHKEKERRKKLKGEKVK